MLSYLHPIKTRAFSTQVKHVGFVFEYFFVLIFFPNFEIQNFFLFSSNFRVFLSSEESFRFRRMFSRISLHGRALIGNHFGKKSCNVLQFDRTIHLGNVSFLKESKFLALIYSRNFQVFLSHNIPDPKCFFCFLIIYFIMNDFHKRFFFFYHFCLGYISFQNKNSPYFHYGTLKFFCLKMIFIVWVLFIFSPEKNTKTF